MSILRRVNPLDSKQKPKEKEKSSLLLDLYEFDFNTIFLHQDIYNSFYQFICHDLKVLSYRQLDFLNETAAISTLPNFKAKQKFAEIIINRYIKKGGDRELYLSQNERDTILKEKEVLEEFIKEKGYDLAPEFFFDDLFTKARGSILSQIKRDVFPKFHKSKECKNVLKNYVDDPKVIVLTLVKDFPYKDKDFQIPGLTEKDFRMINGLALEDLAWDYVDSLGDDFSCYTCEKKYFPNLGIVDHLVMTKIEGIIPFPFQKVVCSLYSKEHLPMIFPFLSKWDHLESLSYEDSQKRSGNVFDLKRQNFVVSMGEYNYPYPLNMLRKSVVVSGVEYQLKKEEVLILFKPYLIEIKNEKIVYNKLYEQLNAKKKKENYVYSFDFKGYLIQMVDNNTTKITEVNGKKMFSLIYSY